MSDHRPAVWGESGKKSVRADYGGNQPRTGIEQTTSTGVMAPPAQDGPDATDAARELADELGVDLATVTGTGKGDKITIRDVQAAADSSNGT